MPENKELAEFWEKLDQHDWYYQMSDDGRVYRAGAQAENLLLNEARTSLFKMALYNAFHLNHFSGKTWGTEKAPKPQKPE